jgi:hypothetical protein
MSDSSLNALHLIQTTLTRARTADANPDTLLAALTALRELRDELTAWEPELITAARAQGTSWTALAPALGVASRQAAERRYLRLKPSSTGESTGEARVHATRDQRAGDRAVANWARTNSATLRTLAGEVGSLDDLDVTAPHLTDDVRQALGNNDVTALLAPLAATHNHLLEDDTGHVALTAKLEAIAQHTDQLRRNAITARHDNTPPTD